jgi:hypothetical protein
MVDRPDSNKNTETREESQAESSEESSIAVETNDSDVSNSSDLSFEAQELFNLPAFNMDNSIAKNDKVNELFPTLAIDIPSTDKLQKDELRKIDLGVLGRKIDEQQTELTSLIEIKPDGTYGVKPDDKTQNGGVSNAQRVKQLIDAMDTNTDLVVKAARVQSEDARNEVLNLQPKLEALSKPLYEKGLITKAMPSIADIDKAIEQVATYTNPAERDQLKEQLTQVRGLMDEKAELLLRYHQVGPAEAERTDFLVRMGRIDAAKQLIDGSSHKDFHTYLATEQKINAGISHDIKAIRGTDNAILRRDAAEKLVLANDAPGAEAEYKRALELSNSQYNEQNKKIADIEAEQAKLTTEFDLGKTFELEQQKQLAMVLKDDRGEVMLSYAQFLIKEGRNVEASNLLLDVATEHPTVAARIGQETFDSLITQSSTTKRLVDMEIQARASIDKYTELTMQAQKEDNPDKWTEAVAELEKITKSPSALDIKAANEMLAVYEKQIAEEKQKPIGEQNNEIIAALEQDKTHLEGVMGNNKRFQSYAKFELARISVMTDNVANADQLLNEIAASDPNFEHDMTQNNPDMAKQFSLIHDSVAAYKEDIREKPWYEDAWHYTKKAGSAVAYAASASWQFIKENLGMVVATAAGIVVGTVVAGLTCWSGPGAVIAGAAAGMAAGALVGGILGTGTDYAMGKDVTWGSAGQRMLDGGTGALGGYIFKGAQVGRAAYVARSLPQALKPYALAGFGSSSLRRTTDAIIDTASGANDDKTASEIVVGTLGNIAQDTAFSTMLGGMRFGGYSGWGTASVLSLTKNAAHEYFTSDKPQNLSEFSTKVAYQSFVGDVLGGYTTSLLLGRGQAGFAWATNIAPATEGGLGRLYDEVSATDKDKL